MGRSTGQHDAAVAGSGPVPDVHEAPRIGRRHPVSVPIDQPEGCAVGEQHVRGTGLYAELLTQPLKRCRPVLGQLAEHVELGDRDDEQVGRVHPVAQSAQDRGIEAVHSGIIPVPSTSSGQRSAALGGLRRYHGAHRGFTQVSLCCSSASRGAGSRRGGARADVLAATVDVRDADRHGLGSSAVDAHRAPFEPHGAGQVTTGTDNDVVRY